MGKKAIKILNSIFIGIFILSMWLLYTVITTPTALDVYQGKTELKITYEGNVPVDSVVIFKKK